MQPGGEAHDRTVRFVIGVVAVVTSVWIGVSTVIGEMLLAVAFLLFLTGALRIERVRRLLGGGKRPPGGHPGGPVDRAMPNVAGHRHPGRRA